MTAKEKYPKKMFHYKRGVLKMPYNVGRFGVAAIFCVPSAHNRSPIKNQSKNFILMFNSIRSARTVMISDLLMIFYSSPPLLPNHVSSRRSCLDVGFNCDGVFPQASASGGSL